MMFIIYTNALLSVALENPMDRPGWWAAVRGSRKRIGHDLKAKQQPINQPVDNPDRKETACCDLQSKEVPTWLSSPSRKSAVVYGPFADRRGLEISDPETSG